MFIFFSLFRFFPSSGAFVSRSSVTCFVEIYVDLILWLFLSTIITHPISTSSSFALQLAINCCMKSNRISTRSGCAGNLSQNMFFTGTTIPLSDVMHQNHQSVAMTQNRTPPTLFQYPSKCRSIVCFLNCFVDCERRMSAKFGSRDLVESQKHIKKRSR